MGWNVDGIGASPEGADWKALARVALDTLSVTEVITCFAGEWDGSWISALHAASSDATSLVCTVGRPTARSGGNGEGAGYSVEYFLCRIDVATAAVEPVTLLRNTFF